MTDARHDSEAEGTEGSCPPAESIADAFRKALENGVTRESGAGRRVHLKHEASFSPSVEVPADASWQERESIEAWVEETLAAFWSAGGTVWETRTEPEETSSEGKPTEGGRYTPRAGTPSNGDPGAQESDENRVLPDIEEGAGKRVEADDVSESLALGFRRAFFKRRVRHEPLTQEGTGEVHDEPTLPPRPNASFLWVAPRSQNSNTAVGVEELSGSRVRRAGAFLLRGTGDDPCQLLRHIRRHPVPYVRLKPVFWRCVDGQQSPVADHVDGVWTPQADREDLRALRKHAAAIRRRVRDVVEAEGRTDASPERRVAQFVATRTDEFSVRRSEDGTRKPMYPKLGPLLSPRTDAT